MTRNEVAEQGPLPGDESDDADQDEGQTGSPLRNRWSLDHLVLLLGVMMATAIAL